MSLKNIRQPFQTLFSLVPYDARRESSENWNNLLFFGKSEVGLFFGKVSFSTRHKNDKLDCTLQRTCIGTILFFCLFFRHLTLLFLAGIITYSSQSVPFTFFLLTFFIFYFINVLILFNYYYKKCY